MEKITKVMVEGIVAKGFGGITEEDFEVLTERALKSYKDVDYSKTKRGKEAAEKRTAILEVFMEMEGEVTGAEIAEHAGVSKQSVATALKALVDEGKVEKWTTSESYKDEDGKRKTRATTHYRKVAE